LRNLKRPRSLRFKRFKSQSRNRLMPIRRRSKERRRKLLTKTRRFRES